MPKATPSISKGTFSHLMTIALVGYLFYGWMYLLGILDWGWGRARALALLPIGMALPFLACVAMPRRPDRGALTLWLALGCSILGAWHGVAFLQYLPHPRLNDIGSATMAASDAILQGKNPYRLPIDLEPMQMPGLERLTGYKYMPLMAFVYMPLSWAFRDRGVLVTNFLLDLATAWLVFRVARSLGGRDAGLLATSLYLAAPFVTSEVLGINVTDLAAVVFLLSALLLVDDRPMLAGLAVGLSTSVKLLPGVLLVPCCLPPVRWGRYAIGLVTGLLPVIVFFALSPREMIANTILFNALRPPDSTSWLYGMPTSVVSFTKYAYLSALIVSSLRAIRSSANRRLADRCGSAAMLIIGATLSGPINHRNYLLWYLPLLAALVGSAAFRLVSDGNSHDVTGASIASEPVGLGPEFKELS